MLENKLHGHRDKVTGVKFLDVCSLVSASHDRTLRTWDLNKGSAVSTMNSCGSRIHDMCTTA